MEETTVSQKRCGLGGRGVGGSVREEKSQEKLESFITIQTNGPIAWPLQQVSISTGQNTLLLVESGWGGGGGGGGGLWKEKSLAREKKIKVKLESFITIQITGPRVGRLL